MHEMDVKAFPLPCAHPLSCPHLTMHERASCGFSDPFSFQLEKTPQNQKVTLFLKKSIFFKSLYRSFSYFGIAAFSQFPNPLFETEVVPTNNRQIIVDIHLKAEISHLSPISFLRTGNLQA